MIGWSNYALDEISESCLGKMLDAKKNKGQLMPYLSNKKVQWGRFDLDDLSKMKFEASESERYGLVPGDLVICEGGEPGRCAIWKGEVPNMKIQKALHRLRVKKGFDNYFVYYRLLLASRLNQLDKYFIGSTIKHLTGVNLKRIEFRYPDYSNQVSISSILRNLDSKIDLNTHINAELEAMAKLIYDYWFVQFDFPITAAQAAAMGRPELQGKPYKSSGGKMVWNGELKREVPEGWEVDNISAFAEILGGGTPSKKEPKYWNGSIPFFTPSDAEPQAFKLKTEDWITEEGLKNSSTKLFPKGTIFITARGSVGNIMIAAKDMAMNQSCYAFRPHTDVNYPFVYFSSKSLIGYLKAKSSGSVFMSIVSNDIKQTPLAVAPRQIIAMFGEITLPIFDKILVNTKENQELASLRDWLLPMLMNGQVRVRDVKGYGEVGGVGMAAEPRGEYGS